MALGRLGVSAEYREQRQPNTPPPPTPAASDKRRGVNSSARGGLGGGDDSGLGGMTSGRSAEQRKPNPSPSSSFASTPSAITYSQAPAASARRGIKAYGNKNSSTHNNGAATVRTMEVSYYYPKNYPLFGERVDGPRTAPQPQLWVGVWMVTPR
mmetsp:Transcript_42122/g.103864  ORF Transcript_42122/g.103864 Transcript_42122/m.103864 type:complete len:154 (+) Transcript_42122:707-1168(+)